MRHDLPRGTVTFLFTDVEASTKLLHQLGEEVYAEKLTEHRRVVRQACAVEDGAEVDTQGDSFFFAFPSARGAAAAAHAITEALASGLVHLRIGLHTGTPHVTDEGYVGDDVHLAARVAASGHGGQVVLSQATSVLLDGDAPLTDLGEHRLKDIEEAVPIFQLGNESFPPLKTISNTNLPRPASSFVGRSSEIQDVLSLLEHGARLLTLTGPGGSGKTRLALEAAATLVPAYSAGVFWVSLAALRESALVTETISRTLGAKEGLAEHIGEREMLVLIDNLEQVVEAAPELAALLERCSHLTILVTSRELLRVRGEIEYPVPPLAEDEAVELFCARSGLEASDELGELCARLDSLPLAVELAAARTKALSPKQILHRLAQRLDLLRGGRDADPRQRTLRATIEWSYELLPPDEQQLFGRLSVFVGGSTLEAADAVAEGDVNTLQALVEKSLLRFTRERYWMLETISEYSAQCLEASGEASSIRRRHAEHFLTLAVEAEPHLREAQYTDWLDRLDAELGNLRDTRAYFRATEDPAAELQLAASLERYWVIRGHLSEGRRALHDALAVAPDDLVELRLRALLGAAHFARLHGDNESAKSQSAEALELARGSRDLVRTGAALNTLASLALDDDDFDLASQLLEEAIAAIREAKDDRALAIATNTRAYIALTRGDHSLAVALFDETLALGRAMDSPEVMALASLNLGAALLALGEVEAASSAYVDALRLSAELGSRVWISYAQEGLAAVSVAWGHMDGALELVASAEAMRAELEISLDPAEQRIHEATLKAIRGAFPEQVVADAVGAARQLSTEEALSLALESAD